MDRADEGTAADASGSVRAGVGAAVPLAVAVGIFGVSFGVLGVSAGGMGALPALVMSVTTFAGSAQFAAASVLAGGGGPVAAITAAVLLNLRYGPIGVSVARFLPRDRWRRLAASQLVVDESWAIASRGDGRYDPHRLLGAGVLLYAVWVGGTLMGVIGGEALGDPETLGLDAAFPALFLALLVGQLRGRGTVPVLVALLGAAIAIALIPVAPPGVPIIAAALAALVGLRR